MTAHVRLHWAQLCTGRPQLHGRYISMVQEIVKDGVAQLNRPSLHSQRCDQPLSGVREGSALYWTIPVWTLIGSSALFVHIGCTHMR